MPLICTNPSARARAMSRYCSVARRTSATTSSAVREPWAYAEEATSARARIAESGRNRMDASVPLRALVRIDAPGNAPLRREGDHERHLSRLPGGERQRLDHLLGLALHPWVPDPRLPGTGRERFEMRLALLLPLR